MAISLIGQPHCNRFGRLFGHPGHGSWLPMRQVNNHFKNAIVAVDIAHNGGMKSHFQNLLQARVAAKEMIVDAHADPKARADATVTLNRDSTYNVM